MNCDPRSWWSLVPAECPSGSATSWGGRPPETLDGLESSAAQRSPDTKALPGAVADDHEDSGVSIVGEASGGVDDPHQVGRICGNRAVVGLRSSDTGVTFVGEDVALAHDPEHAPNGEADSALTAQPCQDPSPTKRFEARTERIPARSSSSERNAFGPRLVGILGAASVCALWGWTVAQESRHARQPRRTP